MFAVKLQKLSQVLHLAIATESLHHAMHDAIILLISIELTQHISHGLDLIDGKFKSR